VAHAAVRGIEIDEIESSLEGAMDLNGFHVKAGFKSDKIGSDSQDRVNARRSVRVCISRLSHSQIWPGNCSGSTVPMTL
jgi:hypothetical protein